MSDNAKKSTDKKGNDPGISGTKPSSSLEPQGDLKLNGNGSVGADDKASAHKRLDPLSALEEDDEFEEFEEEDWPDDPSAQDDLAGLGIATATVESGTHLGTTAEPATKTDPSASHSAVSEPLWDSTWDDDEDIGDDFSAQLKKEIEKLRGTGTLVT